MTELCISESESALLMQLESVIENGLQTFLEVGAALMEIRDRRLYRLTHETFADYCRERWRMTDGRARQLILGYELQRELGSDITLPSEAAARMLRRFPAELRPAIAKIAMAEARALKRELNGAIIRSVGEVLEQAAQTGAVDVDGMATPLGAAIFENYHEGMQRQREHIIANSARVCLARALPAEVGSAIGDIIALRFIDAPPELQPGQHIYVTIYTKGSEHES